MAPRRLTQDYAAIFVDYENVYYHLRNTYADIPELSDFVVELLMNLQSHLERKFGLRSIIAKAYADYERIKSTPQGSLYLMGVETVYVLGTDHKNAADMKLCIDAMEVLYTRVEIGTFVVVAGDRDYIPLIQHLKKQAKSVIAVGFEGSFSGDLMTNVGRSNFIDASALLSPERIQKLEEVAQKYRDYEKAEAEREAERAREPLERSRPADAPMEAQKPASDDQPAPPSTETLPEPVVSAGEPETPRAEAISVVKNASAIDVGKAIVTGDERGEGFHHPITDLTEEERACLNLMVTQFGNHPEVYLSPFLRRLADMLPKLADWQRKALLSDLEFKGAIRMEKRTGLPYDYTVVILNWNHPVVREMC